jgi:hypothetical protein
LGDGSLFTAEIHKEASHQILVSPKERHGHSNLLVSLKGLDLPLVIRLSVVSGLDPKRQVDGLVNFQIKNATRPTAEEAGGPLSPSLSIIYDLLEGLDPPGGAFLPVDPALVEGQVFQPDQGESIFVRTPLKLAWPAWSERVKGPGDFAVYEIPPVAEIVVHNQDRDLRVNLPKVRLKTEVAR